MLSSLFFFFYNDKDVFCIAAGLSKMNKTILIVLIHGFKVRLQMAYLLDPVLTGTCEQRRQVKDEDRLTNHADLIGRRCYIWRVPRAPTFTD